jgi:hypothetical protein
VRGNARKRHSAWKTRRRFPIFSRIAYYNPKRPPTVLDALDHVWKLKGSVTSISFVDGDGGKCDASGAQIVDKFVACTVRVSFPKSINTLFYL